MLFLVAPQIAPFSIGEEPANWGEQVSAMCSILKGDSPIEIRWSLNGEPITRTNHPDITVTKTGKKNSVLIIDSVTAHHAGEYTCVASNLVGSVSRSAELSVNGIAASEHISHEIIEDLRPPSRSHSDPFIPSLFSRIERPFDL